MESADFIYAGGAEAAAENRMRRGIDTVIQGLGMFWLNFPLTLDDLIASWHMLPKPKLPEKK